MKNDNVIYCFIISHLAVPRLELCGAHPATIRCKTRIWFRMRLLDFLQAILEGILRGFLGAAISYVRDR